VVQPQASPLQPLSSRIHRLFSGVYGALVFEVISVDFRHLQYYNALELKTFFVPKISALIGYPLLIDLVKPSKYA